MRFFRPSFFQGFDRAEATDFQKLNFTRQQGGDNTFRISPTDNAVKFIFWKSVNALALSRTCGGTLTLTLFSTVQSIGLKEKQGVLFF
jgi:hypothetical protein